MKKLRAERIAFCTYQMKKERPFKIGVHNLLYFLDPEKITKALFEKVYRVHSIINIQKSTINSCFLFVELEQNDFSPTIYL